MSARSIPESYSRSACAPEETARDARAPLLFIILKRYLKLLESKNLPAIARELKVDLEELVDASRLLAKLDPKAGRN